VRADGEEFAQPFCRKRYRIRPYHADRIEAVLARGVGKRRLERGWT